MAKKPLFFCHYGYSSYLEYTLACARKTNPKTRLILLGDEANRDVARRNNWEYYCFDQGKSALQSRFNDVFRPVKGVEFNYNKNKKDWLKFVFERWFFVEKFVTDNNIANFWHFDSDTMVLQDLSLYSHRLGGVGFTTQCNGICLNGYVETEVLSEYCNHIVDLFCDEAFLDEQQKEFDTISPGYAFSEMRAFQHYIESSNRSNLHLMKFSKDVVFDDCICQEHGYVMHKLPSGENVKKLHFREGKCFGRTIFGHEKEFLSLNLSWVPDYLFKWVLSSLDSKSSAINDISCSFADRILPIIRRVKNRLSGQF